VAGFDRDEPSVSTDDRGTVAWVTDTLFSQVQDHIEEPLREI
jgi:hypothetical protein